VPVQDPGTKKLVEKVLKDPALYPDEFKAWVPKQVERSPVIKFTADQLPTVDPTHYVGDTGQPAFQNGWANYGGGHEAAGFYIDPWRRVFLCGLIQSGTVGTTIFTLPGGYRPRNIQLFDVQANAALARVDVNTDGTVVATSGSNVWFQLNGVSFRAF
jgi:hypothetical protein